jgi:hypothetical protein
MSVIPARRRVIAMHSPDMPAPMIATRGDLSGVLMALPSFRTVDPGRECLVCLSFED